MPLLKVTTASNASLPAGATFCMTGRVLPYCLAILESLEVGSLWCQHDAAQRLTSLSLGQWLSKDQLLSKTVGLAHLNEMFLYSKENQLLLEKIADVFVKRHSGQKSPSPFHSTLRHRVCWKVSA